MRITKVAWAILLLFLMAAVPLQARADDWDDYLQILNKFYTLDQQDFREISCDIEVPIINSSLGQIHERLGPLSDKIAFKENLSSFSLTYRKRRGLAIHYPSLDIKIISEKGMADPARVKKGIDMIKGGFKQQVEGVAQQLTGYFEGFGCEVPRKSDYRIKEIRNDNGVYTVKYEKDNSSFTEIYSGKLRKVTQTGATGETISSVENYDTSADGKLVLTTAHVDMDQPHDKIKMAMDMSVSYRPVKEIIFPAHIASRVRQSMQSMKIEGQIDIYLKNCTLR